MPFPHAAPSPPCMLTTTVKPIESTVELNRLPPLRPNGDIRTEHRAGWQGSHTSAAESAQGYWRY